MFSHCFLRFCYCAPPPYSSYTFTNIYHDAVNEILQNEITGTQTSFSTNIGGKLSEFHPLFPFSQAPPLLLHIFSLLLPVQLL
jgi:hypothetical protein